MISELLTIENQKIAVYKKGNPTSPAIIFVHGNSLSALSYQNQFNSYLADQYNLIAFDLTGHGLSEPAKDPETMYSIPFFNRILLEIIMTLKTQNAVFIGHSLGGHMLLEAYSELEPHGKGFVIFGAPPLQPDHPVERSHYPNPAFPLAFKGNLSDEELNTLAEMYVIKGGKIPDIVYDNIKRTDPQMRSCLGPNSTADKLSDERAIIAHIKKPIAILHGEGDQIIKASYFDELTIPSLWRGKVQLIPGSGHCPQIENPGVFNKLLSEFLEDVYI